MPEGFKGIGKPFGERYKLQRFGRGGFVSTALRAGVPIVPCSIVGAEEIYPMIGNAKTLARVLGLPYFPITPTFPWLGPLGAVPLPTKSTIQFGEPIPTDGYPPEAADDPMLMFNLTDQVRERSSTRSTSCSCSGDRCSSERTPAAPPRAGGGRAGARVRRGPPCGGPCTRGPRCRCPGRGRGLGSAVGG